MIFGQIRTFLISCTESILYLRGSILLSKTVKLLFYYYTRIPICLYVFTCRYLLTAIIEIGYRKDSYVQITIHAI